MGVVHQVLAIQRDSCNQRRCPPGHKAHSTGSEERQGRRTMATLIPSDLSACPAVLPEELFTGQVLARDLPRDACIWYNPANQSNRPRFVGISPLHGVIGVDTCDALPLLHSG